MVMTQHTPDIQTVSIETYLRADIIGLTADGRQVRFSYLPAGSRREIDITTTEVPDEEYAERQGDRLVIPLTDRVILENGLFEREGL